jgi:uracil-DNA glycosylase
MDHSLTWSDFVRECQSCTRCDLSKTRTHVVVYRGSVRAPLMFVGEGPGASEDAQGIPFVGAAGKLLDLLLTAFDLTPDLYHICNIVKCRPPENRAPSPDEAAACKKLLATQIRFVKPKIIVLLGATAYKNFTGLTKGITQIRGQWIEKNGFYILPTYHPAYILRNNNERITLWKDLEQVRDKLEEMGFVSVLDDVPSMPTGRKPPDA